jgi:hypothetical protein
VQAMDWGILRVRSVQVIPLAQPPGRHGCDSSAWPHWCRPACCRTWPATPWATSSCSGAPPTSSRSAAALHMPCSYAPY